MSAILLFDGVCNLCTWAVQFILPRDKAGYFQFASLQSPIGKQLVEKHSAAAPLPDSVILIEDDQRLLSTLAIGGGAPPPPPATLSEALGHSPAVDDIAVALGEAIERVEGVRPIPLSIDPALRARVSALIVRYLDPTWTWRR